MLILKNFFLSLLFILIVSSNAESKNNTFFIDIQFVINNSTIGKRTLEELSKKNIEQNKILLNKKKIIEENDNEIKKLKNVISENDLKNKIDILKKQIAEFNKEKSNIDKSFNKEKNQKLENVFKKINPLISNYMKANSIAIVLDKKYIYLGDVNYDITTKILEIVNNKFE
jgi:outer membrane protein